MTSDGTSLRAALTAVRLVARRELVVRIRERGFQVSAAITLLVVVGIIVIPRLLDRGPASYRVGVVGTATRLAPEIERSARASGVTVHVVTVASVAEATSQLTHGSLDAAVDGTRRILTKGTLDARLAAVLQGAHQQQVMVRGLVDAGVSASRIPALLAVPPLPVESLRDSGSGGGQRQLVATVAVFVLYGQMIGYAMWVALGVVEEKSSRVVELLLAALKPWQLLAGKVTGIGLLGLLQFTLVGVVAAGLAVGMGVVAVPADAIGTIGHVLVWFVFGYVFYACLAAAIAARVSRQEDLQNAIGPMQILLMGSLFVALFAGQQPDSPVAAALSYVPPFSALLMPLRVAAGVTGIGSSVLAMAIMAVATAGLVRLAGWVYAGAVLRTGGRVRFREALRAGRGR